MAVFKIKTAEGWVTIGQGAGTPAKQSKVLVIDSPEDGLTYALWYVEAESKVLGLLTHPLGGGGITVTASVALNDVVAAGTWVTATTSAKSGTVTSVSFALVFQPTGG